MKNIKITSDALSHGIARVIEDWPIDSLTPYAGNARTHSPEQIAQIAESIQQWGFTNPVIVSAEDGVIIAGHGRVLAAQRLKHVTVPVITITGLSEAKRRALVIADNKLTMNAGWDNDLLAAEIDQLKDEDFDIALLGFTDAELADLVGSPDDPIDHMGVSDVARHLLLIELNDEAALQTLFNELRERGLSVKVMD